MCAGAITSAAPSAGAILVHMPSPFPGMDPYLEGHLWPDVHHRLASEIARQVGPRLAPRYVARIETTVVRDRAPEVEIGVMVPDVSVIERGSGQAPGQAPGRAPRLIREAGASGPAGLVLAAPLLLPRVAPVDVRVASVEVRDAASNRLVTGIEIMSPVNKRGPGLERYRRKRDRLIDAGVHVLEIDLVRRGARAVEHALLPAAAYLVTLTRAGASAVEAWPLDLRDPLPTLPIPLLAPDPDVPLDLAAALAAIYDEAGYDLSIDYHRPPPPPPLSEDDRAWAAARVADGEAPREWRAFP